MFRQQMCTKEYDVTITVIEPLLLFIFHISCHVILRESYMQPDLTELRGIMDHTYPMVEFLNRSGITWIRANLKSRMI